MTVKELLIGCGRKRVKEVLLNTTQKEFHEGFVTLDINEDHNPDVLWDLENFPYPFKDNEFDEIHAYEVLEHTGRQGDWKFFFRQWEEFWRILKPNGQFFGTSPIWYQQWAWGDPGHTRTVQPENFHFLSQENYAKEVGLTPMTDYRRWFKGDFETLATQPMAQEDAKLQPVRWAFILQAHKPARVFK